MRRAAPFLFGAEVLGWALWFGGLVTVALVAPLVFQVVPSRDLAGRVFGAVLGRLFPLVYVCGGVQLLAGLGRTSAGRLTWVKHALVALVLAIAAYTGVVVMGEMVGIQNAFSAPIENIPQDDPQRLRFDALHRLSERLMGIDVVLGLLLLPLMVATRPRLVGADEPDARSSRARQAAAAVPSP
jgi:hypothetical protein